MDGLNLGPTQVICPVLLRMYYLSSNILGTISLQVRFKYTPSVLKYYHIEARVETCSNNIFENPGKTEGAKSRQLSSSAIFLTFGPKLSLLG